MKLALGQTIILFLNIKRNDDTNIGNNMKTAAGRSSFLKDFHGND